MNFRNNKFYLEEARPQDANAMLELLEENAFDGTISIVYTRRPDPYVSYGSEGDKTITIICREEVTDSIIGMGICSIRNLYIDGCLRKVGYLEGLRLKAQYRNRWPIIPQAYRFLYEKCKAEGVDCFVTTILEENKTAQKLLEKKRRNMPSYHYIEDYEVFVYKTGGRFNVPEGFWFRQATEEDIPSLLEFYDKYGKQSQLFPEIGEDIFYSRYPGLSIENFYVLLKDDRIIASGAIWNQRSYKQYIIKKYSSLFKVLQKISPLLNIVGFPKLPPEDGKIPLNSISFVVVEENNDGIIYIYLNKMKTIAPKYELISIGLLKNHPFTHYAQKIKHVVYRSKVYAVNFEGDEMNIDLDKGRIIYLECALL